MILEPYWIDYYEQVVRTGMPLRVENYWAHHDRWLNIHCSLVGDLGSNLVAVVFDDVTDRKKAEIALRESEARQAFLLTLSDALRPLSDPIAIQETAMRVLGAHMNVSRAFYGEMLDDADTLRIGLGYVHETFPLEGHVKFSEFDTDMLVAYRNGKTVVIDNVHADSMFSSVSQAAFDAIHVRSVVGVPLVKDDRVRAIVSLHQFEPRKWTQAETALLEETAERTWSAVERARAEAPLRASEERFQQFAAAASSALWIRDANTLAMEYASPAIAKVYGVDPDAFLGDFKRWAAFIVPEDRETAVTHIQQARQGNAVVHEFRIQRATDQVFRWIRDTDFPLFDNHGRVQRIGGIGEDVTEAKLAVEHQGVLLAELQHRVRNIMAIIRSITARTAECAESVRSTPA